MFEVLNILFPFLLYLSQGCCLPYFYGNFLEGRMKNKRLNGLGAAAMYVGLKMALEQIELWEIWD